MGEWLGLGDLIAQHLTESRGGKNTELPLVDSLRQFVTLSQDPDFRLIGSEKILEHGAALTSRLQSFETEVLGQEENLAGLAAINRDLIGNKESVGFPQCVVLDMDSNEIPVYGQQENSAHDSHFESTCYHPLWLFNREGDCLAGKLRPGNHTVPRTGKNGSCRRSSGNRRWAKRWCSGPGATVAD